MTKGIIPLHVECDQSHWSGYVLRTVLVIGMIVCGHHAVFAFDELDSVDASYHRGELALAEGRLAVALREYDAVIDAARTLELDVREYYTGAALFGKATTAAFANDTAQTRAWVDAACANHFWAFASLEQNARIVSVAGAAFVDSVTSYWKRVRAREREQWRPWEPIVIRPRDRRAARGTILALHGGNGNLRQFAAHWEEVADSLHMTVVVPPGPYRLSPINFSWEFNDDVIDSAFTALITRKDIRAIIGKKPLYLAGFSQGGHAAIIEAMRKPGVVRGSIIIEGFFQEPGDFSRVDFTRSNEMRIYGIYGSYANSAFRTSFERFATLGAEGGIAVKLIRIPTMVHELPVDLVDKVRDGLRWINARPGSVSRHAGAGRE